MCDVYESGKPIQICLNKPREKSMKNRGKSPVSDHHNRNIKDTRGSSSGRSLAGSGTSREQDVSDVIHPQQVIIK